MAYFSASLCFLFLQQQQMRMMRARTSRTAITPPMMPADEPRFMEARETERGEERRVT